MRIPIDLAEIQLGIVRQRAEGIRFLRSEVRVTLLLLGEKNSEHELMNV